MSQSVYTYTPIDLGTDGIRLVHLFKGRFTDPIQCELFETELHDVGVPYEALSYTWGGTLKTAKVTLGECTLKITENLYDALQYLRWNDKDRILWIDAICINQDNKREQGHQVSQMKSIYKTAQRVIIWLGLSSYNIDRLMELAINAHKNLGATREYLRQIRVRWNITKPIEQQHAQSGSFYEEQYAELHETIQLLFQRPWFRRIWVIQEVANAKAASVMCGHKSVSTRTFTEIPSLLGIEPNPHAQAVLDVMPGHLREMSWWSQSQDLHTLLQKFRESEATDPRDKIYALLGISSDASRNDILYPDYEKSLQQVIDDTISFLLFRGVGGCRFPPWSLQTLLQNLNDLPYKVLQWAFCNHEELTCMRLLAVGKIDVNMKFKHIETLPSTDKCEHAHTPLSFMTQHWRERNITKAILTHPNVDVNLDLPLAKAVHKIDKWMVKRLVRKGADVNSRDNNGRTPLSWLEGRRPNSINGSENVHDVDSLDDNSRTPPPDLLDGQKYDVVESESDSDADPRDSNIQISGWLAGWFSQDAIKIFILLLDNGADICSRDNNGRTALSWAMGIPDDDIILRSTQLRWTDQLIPRLSIKSAIIEILSSIYDKYYRWLFSSRNIPSTPRP